MNFKPWLEWDFIHGKEPVEPAYDPERRPAKPQRYREPEKDQNPTMMLQADSPQAKINAVIRQAHDMDPQRVQWFIKVMGKPSNQALWPKLAAKITSPKDLLLFIGQQQKK